VELKKALPAGEQLGRARDLVEEEWEAVKAENTVSYEEIR